MVKETQIKTNKLDAHLMLRINAYDSFYIPFAPPPPPSVLSRRVSSLNSFALTQTDTQAQHDATIIDENGAYLFVRTTTINFTKSK